MPDFAPIQLKDLDEIRKLQPPDWPDIIPYFQFYVNSGFSAPVKVVSDGRIIGVGCSINHNGTSWLAHIIVDPEFRKLGIGGRIVDHLLSDPEIRDINTILLIATKAGESLYHKKGFRKVSDYIFLKKEKQISGWNTSEKIKPYDAKYFRPLIDLDQYVSGEDRSLLLSMYLGGSFLFLDHGTLNGFFIPDLGEGLIVADTREAGIELMKMKFGKAEKAVLPVENQIGIDFLRENGFNETLRAQRMILGDPIPWRPEKIFSRIGGNLG